MRRHTTLTLGFGLIFCFGLLTFGCGSDETTTKKDAGRGGAGGSGKGGAGGSAGAGGSSAKGGAGGSAGAGGSSAQGGAGGSGGSAGAGGSSAQGGAGGSAGAGGSSVKGGAGGGAGGSGGSLGHDGGTVDGSQSDAIDAPLVSDDGGPGDDTVKADVGTPVTIDAEALDLAALDTTPIDTTVVTLDVGPTVEVSVDHPEPDVALDVAKDSGPNPVPCSSVEIVTIAAGQTSRTYQPNTSNSFCFATCDDIAGWTCSQMGSRQIYLDGQLIANCSSNPPVPAKLKGTHHVFQLSAGDSSASVTWWMNTAGTGDTCAPPAGGFGLE